jgi:hypothetical protein
MPRNTNPVSRNQFVFPVVFVKAALERVLANNLNRSQRRC